MLKKKLRNESKVYLLVLENIIFNETPISSTDWTLYFYINSHQHIYYLISDNQKKK